MTKTQCLNKLVKMLCAKEKGKQQMNSGQCRNVLKSIVDLYNDGEGSEFAVALALYITLSKKKAKKKK